MALSQKEIWTVKKHYGAHIKLVSEQPDGSILISNDGSISKVSKPLIDKLVQRNHHVYQDREQDLTHQVMSGMSDLERKGYDIGITEHRKGEVSGNPFHKIDKRAMSKAGMSEGMQDALSSEHEEGWLPSDDTSNRGLPSRSVPAAKPAGLPSQRR